MHLTRMHLQTLSARTASIIANNVHNIITFRGPQAHTDQRAGHTCRESVVCALALSDGGGSEAQTVDWSPGSPAIPCLLLPWLAVLLGLCHLSVVITPVDKEQMEVSGACSTATAGAGLGA